LCGETVERKKWKSLKAMMTVGRDQSGNEKIDLAIGLSFVLDFGAVLYSNSACNVHKAGNNQTTVELVNSYSETLQNPKILICKLQ